MVGNEYGEWLNSTLTVYKLPGTPTTSGFFIFMETYDPYTTEEIMALERRIDDLEVEKRQLAEAMFALIDTLKANGGLSNDDSHDLKLGLPQI